MNHQINCPRPGALLRDGEDPAAPLPEIGDECNQQSITQQTRRSTRIERKGFPANAEQSTAGWRSTAERWNEIKVETGGKINLTGFSRRVMYKADAVFQ